MKVSGKYEVVTVIDNHGYRGAHKTIDILFVDHNGELCATLPKTHISLCINSVYKDEEGRWHLSRHATFTLNREHQQELLDKGILTVKGWCRNDHVFKLVGEPEDEETYNEAARQEAVAAQTQ